MAPTRTLSHALLLAAALLGGCSGDDDAAPVATPMPATLADTYTGRFPCSNCAAIAATLWLRPDGRFILRQTFADDATTDPAPAAETAASFSLGRWHWDELRAEVVLRGAGPERRLVVRDADRLQLRVASPAEHLLARDHGVAPFADRLTLDGESAVTDKGVTFRECLTGLTFPVAESAGLRDLRRYHRRTNPLGKVALTTVEGHLVTVASESATSERLVVDRFVAMKPGTPCPGERS